MNVVSQVFCLCKKMLLFLGDTWWRFWGEVQVSKWLHLSSGSGKQNKTGKGKGGEGERIKS